MDSTIIIALISLLGTAFGSLAGALTSNRLVLYRLEKLEEKVNKHNNLVERMILAENKISNLEKEISNREKH